MRSVRFGTVLRTGCCLLFLVLLAGCAGEQVNKRRFFWPQPPERPRIEWLGAYASQNDFPKVGMAKLVTELVGETDALIFEKPLDIRSDGEGKVYVADPGIPGVYIYDMKNRTVHLLGKGIGEAFFSRPTALALDAAGNLYVSDTEKKMVLVFDKNEHPLRKLDMSAKVNAVGGIVIDNQKQRLICTDIRGHKVAVFDLQGNFLFSFGERGDSDGKFNFPAPVTINSKGEIIVGDAMNARIQIFDQDGKFLRKFGQRGDSPSEFQLMKGVAVDSEDHIYVSDGKGNKIEIFSPSGEYLMTFGTRKGKTANVDVAGGFVLPQGIHIDKTDTIYVVDQMNLRFQVFRYISDSFLKMNPIPGYVPEKEGGS